MARKGLGKGLDSLIPDFYDEDFDSNSTQSLEDILNDNEDEQVEEIESSVEEEKPKNIFEEIEEENDQEITSLSNSEEEIQETIPDEEKTEEIQEDDSPSEINSGDNSTEENVQTSQEIKVQKEHVDEVKKIVDKNPRITLWSSRSSAVFRYLRKTEPEFSISKEASVLIEEAVSKKYPEIWALFEDY